MSYVYSDMPKYHGERSVADQLSSFADQKLHLWFGINYVPGVTDIDILLWHEDIGVFVIEVKAVPLYKIQNFGLNKCKIEGRKENKSPQVQAMEAWTSLSNYLKANGIFSPPFFVPTVCFPMISRKDWNDNWSNEQVIGQFAESIIFSEDLHNGIETLKDRLLYIYFNPPIRKGSIYNFSHDPKKLKKIRNCLDCKEKNLFTESDYQRLRNIEKGIEKEIRKQFNPSVHQKVIFEGYPGTGKTFRLLQIGFYHAQKSNKVLFCCYNKTLAADIKRLLCLAFSEGIFNNDNLNDIILDCYDIFNLMAVSGLRPDSDIDIDDWGELVYEELSSKHVELLKYDTVLIDEAQDMKNWQLKLISLYSHKDSTICVAAGKGQELYINESAEWLHDFRDYAEKKQLRRNFRNTQPVFQVSHLFYDCKLDIKIIPKIIQKFRQNKLEIVFDRPEGRLPKIVEINDKLLNWSESDTFFFAIEQQDYMVKEYKKIFEQQKSELSEDEKPIDILILVPSYNSNERKWAVEALYSLNFDFTDYTESNNRRIPPLISKIRLCTYHSARGLEANKVIILGFENLSKLCNGINADLSHLGYIVLSRSIFDCTIVRRAKEIKSTTIAFIEHSNNYLSEHYIKNKNEIRERVKEKQSNIKAPLIESRNITTENYGIQTEDFDVLVELCYERIKRKKENNKVGSWRTIVLETITDLDLNSNLTDLVIKRLYEISTNRN